MNTNKLEFVTDALFNKLIFDVETDSWFFYFSEKVFISVQRFWRLLENDKIVYVSLDHGNQFGLPKPLDLIEEVTKKLSGKRLLKIEVTANTANLILLISGQLKVEVFITSTGYENYEFWLNDKRYIGLGRGDIAIFDN